MTVRPSAEVDRSELFHSETLCISKRFDISSYRKVSISWDVGYGDVGVAVTAVTTAIRLLNPHSLLLPDP